MIIIGEKLNSSIPSAFKAICENDDKTIIELIKKQEKCGANFIDINTAICEDKELEKMIYIINLVLVNSKCGIVIDSPNPKVVEEALKHTKDRSVIINSITLTSRMEETLPLLKLSKASVICLPMDNVGIPHTIEERSQIARKIIDRLNSEGIESNRIFIDISAESLGVGSENVTLALDTIKKIKADFPNVKTTCGLSNVSFGLPRRNVINTTFFAMAVLNGLDSAIMDITTPRMRETYFAVMAMMGEDEYCMDYIGFTREDD